MKTAPILVLFALLTITGAMAAFRRLELHWALQAHATFNPKSPTIAFVGDSHTAIPDWDLLLKCRNTANFGIGGDTSQKVLRRLDDVISSRPLLVVVMVGTNDVFAKIPSETTILNIEAMKRKLRYAHIAHIVIAPPPLAVSENAINDISDAATLRVPFSSSDLLTDGVHLRSSGYEKWRDAIAPLVKDLCQN